VSAAADSLCAERLQRILKAVALERPDRVPVVLEYSGFAAHVTGTPMAEFLRDPELNLKIMIEAFHRAGAADAVNYGAFWPYGLCHAFMSKVRVPGVELPAGAMWQVVETELMTRADYDRLIAAGWPAYSGDFIRNRILDDAPPEYLPPQRRFPDVRAAWQAAGVPVLSGGDVTTPFEVLCGSRSLPCFFRDLIEIPDKVEAAMEVIVPHLAGEAIGRAKTRGYPAVWVGGWRSAPCLLSPAMWERFAWTYFRRLVAEVTDAGLIALLHLDSDWTRELSRFKELPRGKCIMALDGATEIFKARAVLDGHMVIMGDVPATMLFTGDPQTVHAYCTRLIRELGPEGFILHSGCDIPANARLENVQAMVAAARC
jgi:uroporphyrinogen-III decarboxylase